MPERIHWNTDDLSDAVVQKGTVVCTIEIQMHPRLVLKEITCIVPEPDDA